MNLSASPKTKKHRVFLIDDHPIVRQGLTMLINGQPDLAVCGEADGGFGSLQSALEVHADILVLDISLNGPDGTDLLKVFRSDQPELPVLVLSMHDESTYAERVLRAGANGYIMKQEATEKVLIAIRRILRGEVYLSERLTNRMLQHFVRGSAGKKESPLASLTDRELEVFRLIGEGHATRQIAEELHISIKTVESYQAHIKEKLSLRSARELVQHAIEWYVTQRT